MKHLWKPLMVGTLLLSMLAAAAPQAVMAQSGAAGTCGQNYTVVSGDTLSAIAVNCGVNFSALLNANTQFTNPNLIFPGDVVTMPSVAANNAAGGTTTTANGATTGGTTANNGGSIPNTGSSNSGSTSGNATGNTSGNTTNNNSGSTSGGIGANSSGNTTGTATQTATPAANNAGNNNNGTTTGNSTGTATSTPAANNTGNNSGNSTGNSTGTVTSTPAANNTGNNTNNNTGSVPNTGANASGRTYTVVSGDTMSSIAAAFGVTLADLENANPNISNYDLIFVGDVINLPTNASSSPNTGSTGSTGSIPNTGGTANGSTSGRTYTVQTGDTLTAIAAQNNTTVQALVNANPSITNSDVIFVGQVLNLP